MSANQPSRPRLDATTPAQDVARQAAQDAWGSIQSPYEVKASDSMKEFLNTKLQTSTDFVSILEKVGVRDLIKPIRVRRMAHADHPRVPWIRDGD